MSASTPQYCHEFASSGKCRFGIRCRYLHLPFSPDGSTTPVTAAKKRTRTKRKPKKAVAEKTEPTHLADFFAQYPTFHYNSSESPTKEFQRMRRQLGWTAPPGINPEADAGWNGYRDALALQFGGLYGTDENDIKSWQHLCSILRIDPIPDDLETCRQVVAATHVNLVDLVELGVPPQRDVDIFETEFELSKYTRSTGKFFPRGSAKAGGLLRHLLRRIGRPGIYENRLL